MKRSRPAYTAEFRQQILASLQAGKTRTELATTYGVSQQTIADWQKKYRQDIGDVSAGLQDIERGELFGLRVEIQRIREENHLLRNEMRKIAMGAMNWVIKELETGGI